MHQSTRLPTLAILVLTLLLVTGCAHSQGHPAKPTGSPEALAIVAKLQSLNTQPPAISGTFTWTTTQPQDAYFAECILNQRLPDDYYHRIPATMPATDDPYGARLRRYADDVLRNGVPQGTHTETRRCEQRQRGNRFYVSSTITSDGKQEYPLTITAWNGEVGYTYQPAVKWAQRSFNAQQILRSGPPADVLFFSSHIPFPAITGSVTLRHEQFNGEDLTVLHEDAGQFIREYYLSPKDNYAPRRIVQRMKHKLPKPEKDLEGTIESESGRWPFRHRTTQRTTTPVEPLKFLDWNYGAWDSDTTINATTLRPDGQWLVTDSTTTFPFFRRTETFKAENLSFAPIPATAFTLHLPPDVYVRH